MKIPSISIIIPIYKVEKYLKRCVDSVLAQTFTDLEIILVDDGSPDNCPQMCDMFAEKDSRIKVIHKENGGLASARNAGMRIATGKYISFVDSDDWLKLNMIENVVAIAESDDYDFVRFRAFYADWPGITNGTICNFGTEDMLRNGAYTKEDIIKEIYPYLFGTARITLGPVVSAWRSIYKREFLEANRLFFDEEIKYSEDTIFSARVIRAAKKFYYLKEDAYYYYFYNANSITKAFKADRWEIAKKLMERFEYYFRDDEEYDFSEQLLFQKIYGVLNSLSERKNIKSLRLRYKYCKKIILDPVTKKTFSKLPDVDVSIKLRMILQMIKHKLIWVFLFT